MLIFLILNVDIYLTFACLPQAGILKFEIKNLWEVLNLLSDVSKDPLQRPHGPSSVQRSFWEIQWWSTPEGRHVGSHPE
jgi:hypothetical protein